MKNILLASISFSAYEYIPYPAGVLISYCKRDPKIREKYNFLTPEYRGRALDDDTFLQNLANTDILGLTNWVWNQSYNDEIAKRYKELRPKGIVLYGGTNVPENEALALSYAKERPYVDLFFYGPAEERFRQFLVEFDANGVGPLPGTFSVGKYNKRGSKYPHIDSGIPMPYLDGTFDKLIEDAESPLTAIFETNRGCPYRCSFCDWGGGNKEQNCQS